jgi:hypothetical protein
VSVLVPAGEQRWDDAQAPLHLLTDDGLAECIERATWLTEQVTYVPRGLRVKADTWLADLVAEQEDRATKTGGKQ